MAFRERVAWVSAAATLLVWGWYFIDLAMALGAAPLSMEDAIGSFVQSVFLIVVIQVASITVLAIRNPGQANAPADAREREFEIAACRPAYVVLSLMVAVIMIAAPTAPALAMELMPAEPVLGMSLVLGNALLFALVVAGLVHSGYQIVRYRRGG